MTTKIRFAIIVSVLIASAILATVNATEARVNLFSIVSLWSDVARDTDQIGMRLTRLSDAEAIYQAEPHARHLAACTKGQTCQKHGSTSKRHRSNESKLSRR